MLAIRNSWQGQQLLTQADFYYALCQSVQANDLDGVRYFVEKENVMLFMVATDRHFEDQVLRFQWDPAAQVHVIDYLLQRVLDDWLLLSNARFHTRICAQRHVPSSTL